MNNIAIYGRSFGNQHILGVQSLFEELFHRNKTISIYRPFYDYLKPRIKFKEEPHVYNSNSELQKFAECLFSIGGDGTILDSITFIGKSGIPILGINTGRLGFLSTIKMEDVKSALLQLDNNDYSLEKRMLLQLKTNPTLFKNKNYGLNEVVVHKKDTSSMIAIHTYINDEILNTYWADGLIISTPTGSTAYSLSCGGPIITPGSENFVITPVAPHSLTSRPFVIPATDNIKLKVEGRGKYFLVSLDSRMETFDSDLELEIQRCDFDLNLIRFKSQSFLQTLSNKLNWGIDQRN
ncbi:MAG: NAD kinase [Salibacteraceae bacterium]